MMSFVERIEELLKELGIQKKEMLSELSLNRNSFTAWRDRGTIPSGDTLLSIANYLGTTMEYLLTGDLSKKKASQEEVDSKEALRQAMIKAGIINPDKPLTDAEKDAIMAYAKLLFDQQ